MKIKLSKSQWRMIGTKAGWMKKMADNELSSLKKETRAAAIKMIEETRSKYGEFFVHRWSNGNYQTIDNKPMRYLDYQLTNVKIFEPSYLSKVTFYNSWEPIQINELCDEWRRELDKNIPE